MVHDALFLNLIALYFIKVSPRFNSCKSYDKYHKVHARLSKIISQDLEKKF